MVLGEQLLDRSRLPPTPNVVAVLGVLFSTRWRLPPSAHRPWLAWLAPAMPLPSPPTDEGAPEPPQPPADAYVHAVPHSASAAAAAAAAAVRDPTTLAAWPRLAATAWALPLIPEVEWTDIPALVAAGARRGTRAARGGQGWRRRR